MEVVGRNFAAPCKADTADTVAGVAAVGDILVAAADRPSLHLQPLFAADRDGDCFDLIYYGGRRVRGERGCTDTPLSWHCCSLVKKSPGRLPTHSPILTHYYHYYY